MKATGLWIVALALGGLLGAGCGGGGACERVNARICELACGCTEGDMCKISAGGAIITHDTAADCEGFWVSFGCMQEGSGDVDYGACDTALDSAECTDTGDGMALAFPQECGDADSQQSLVLGRGAGTE